MKRSSEDFQLSREVVHYAGVALEKSVWIDTGNGQSALWFHRTGTAHMQLRYSSPTRTSEPEFLLHPKHRFGHPQLKKRICRIKVFKNHLI